jgi:hypothetical protein
MTIADRTWDSLPAEIHARVMAATAQAGTRQIEHMDTADPAMPRGIWTVHALIGDRFVHQILGLRQDGSVYEETRTFLSADIREISLDGDGATLAVDGPSGREEFRIPQGIGRAINRHTEDGFESGIAQQLEEDPSGGG